MKDDDIDEYTYNIRTVSREIINRHAKVDDIVHALWQIKYKLADNVENYLISHPEYDLSLDFDIPSNLSEVINKELDYILNNENIEFDDIWS